MTTVVTLLTQANCELCDQAKTVLERIAADEPLEIRVVDLGSDDGASLAATIGLAFPPGVLLDGEAFSHGRLSERRLRKELRRRALVTASKKPAEPRLDGRSDPEAPEPALSTTERRAERQRLRAVRQERRRQSLARKKDRKNSKKDNKKDQKGKRR